MLNEYSCGRLTLKETPTKYCSCLFSIVFEPILKIKMWMVFTNMFDNEFLNLIDKSLQNHDNLDATSTNITSKSK